ncbi:MAG: hypothetical protein IKD28_05985 [Clostridia bacterium]|nr:hypothetical protein [Clostridia bacterium]
MNTVTTKAEFKQKSKGTVLPLLKFATVIPAVITLVAIFLPLIRENFDKLNNEGFSLTRLMSMGNATWGCFFFLLAIVPFVLGFVAINILTSLKIKGKLESAKAAKIIFWVGVGAAALTAAIAIASLILQMPFTAKGALGMTQHYHIGIGAYFITVAGLALAAIVLFKGLLLSNLIEGKLGFDKLQLSVLLGGKKKNKKK